MKDFIKYYPNPYEKDLNLGLMTKSYDDDLITYLVECMRSLEILPNIKFDAYEFIDREHQIDDNAFLRPRKNNKKQKRVVTTSIAENRCGELRLYFTLTVGDKQTKILKKILVPLQDEDGYFTLKGMRYMLLYQLLEASTFMSKGSVTLKSLQAVTLIRHTTTVKDINKEEHICPLFNHVLAKRPINVIYFYLAKFGFEGTLSYFHLKSIVDIVCIDDEMDRSKYKDKNVIFVDKWDESCIDPKYIYFPRSKKVLIRVRRSFFDKYIHVRAVIAMILAITTNRLSLQDIYNKNFWLLKLSEANGKNKQKESSSEPSADKGEQALLRFSRLMDRTTSRNLKLSKIHKIDAYAVVRWLMLEYDNLKRKDNMDMENKRIRCHEAITSRLTNDMSTKLTTAINKGKKLDMDDVKQIFKFPGDILIKNLYASGILPFDDRTSDMDFFNKFKYTSKGSNALGNKNEQSISIKYRGIDPSDLGRKDINVCGNSDPGRSGMLTPFCKTYGLFFSERLEPQSKYDELIDDLLEDKDTSNKLIVDIKDKSVEGRTRAHDAMMDSWSKLKIVRMIEGEEPVSTNKEDYKEIV